jgi:hypothetical protein
MARRSRATAAAQARPVSGGRIGHMPAVPVHLVPRPHVIRPAPISHGETLPGVPVLQFCAVAASLVTAPQITSPSPQRRDAGRLEPGQGREVWTRGRASVPLRLSSADDGDAPCAHRAPHTCGMQIYLHMCRELTEALEELKTTALEVRLREREATQAADDLKQQLKEVEVLLARAARDARRARVRACARAPHGARDWWCAAGQGRGDRRGEEPTAARGGSDAADAERAARRAEAGHD